MTAFKNPHNMFNKIPIFQQGGMVGESQVSEEEKEQLFPYFAYLYSQQLNPEKYGKVTNIEDWTTLIQESEEDVAAITEAAAQLSDEDWASLAVQYKEAQAGETQTKDESNMQFAAKGDKLRKLKSAKKGMSVPKKKARKTRKCSCGCKMVIAKGTGGKIIEKCSCGCKK